MRLLPHVSTYKRRWVRRVMIILTLPQSLTQVIYRGCLDVFKGAAFWWNAP